MPEEAEEARSAEADPPWVEAWGEADSVRVCGMELSVTRPQNDYFAACAGDLPITATGTVLWECGLLLANYVGYASWTASRASGAESSAASARPWWQLHHPAPVVPSRYWAAEDRAVLELGGGCGLVAAVLAGLGARVTCTDGDPLALRAAVRTCAEARRRYGRGPRTQWGSVEFSSLPWGDPEAARKMVRTLGPFRFIVGSDLLYGEASPPGPLLETLKAIASEPGGRNAEVVLAMKNRCTDEAAGFSKAAAATGLWKVRFADADDLPEGYEQRCTFSPDGCAYNVIHLTAVDQGDRKEEEKEEGPAAKRPRVAPGAVGEGTAC